jgi:hypothetical protein
MGSSASFGIATISGRCRRSSWHARTSSNATNQAGEQKAILSLLAEEAVEEVGEAGEAEEVEEAEGEGGRRRCPRK